MPTGFFDRIQRLHSMADVERVLNERTKGKDVGLVSTVSTSGCGPGRDGSSPSPHTIEWRALVPGMEAILSACGRYSVARARVNGTASYQAWVRLPTPHRLGEPQESAEAAKQVVEAHAQSR